MTWPKIYRFIMLIEKKVFKVKLGKIDAKKFHSGKEMSKQAYEKAIV